MSSFEPEKSELLDDLALSRADLATVVKGLEPEGFGQARRGSWTIARILDHVLHSEHLYTQLISVFSGQPVTPPEAGAMAEAHSAAAALDAS